MLKIKDLNILKPHKVEYCNPESEIRGAHFDSRKCSAGFLYIAIKGANNDGHDFIKSALDNGAIAAIVDINYKNEQKFPVVYTGSTELFFAEAAKMWRTNSKAKVIGLTGSNGKTSTKEMVGALLMNNFKTIVTEGNFNNQLGVPLTLFRIQPETEIAVIEMGTNHFGEIEFLAEIAGPQIGLITNIGEAHLEALGSKKGVLKEKIALYEYIHKNGGLFLVNADDELLAGYNYSPACIKRYSSSQSGELEFSKFGINDLGFGHFVVNGIEVNLGTYGTTGCKNAVAALSIGSELGLSLESMCETLQGFGAANKRGEIFRTIKSDIIVDCYNANPSSMIESIRNLLYVDPQNIMLVLGDMLELGDSSVELHAELGAFLKKHGFGSILLFGSEMNSCWQVLKDQNNVEYFATDYSELQNRFIALVDKYPKVLLKGSRGMSLERVLGNLTRIDKNE